MPGLIPAIIGIELVLAAWPMVRAAPLGSVTTDPWQVGGLRKPQLASAARSTDAESLVPPRLLRVGNDPSYLRPNFPSLFGLHDVQAYAPMIPRPVAQLLDGVAPGMWVSGSLLGGVLDREDLTRPAVDMLGVNVVFTDDPEWIPTGFVRHETVGHVQVLQNTEALPRAFFASRFHVVADPEVRVARLSDQSFDPRRTIVLEEAPRGLVNAEIYVDQGTLGVANTAVPQLLAKTAPQRDVFIESYAPGKVQLRVGPGEPGMLVLSESWHPGWLATVDEEVIETQVANHALVGVPVAAEKTVVVELVFEPNSYHWGRLWGWLGVLGLVAWLLEPRLRQQQSRRAEAGGG